MKISRVTEERVADRLRDLGASCAAAAEIAKVSLKECLESIRPSDSQFCALVRQVCRGAMSGLLAANRSLSLGAIKLIEAATEVAAEHQYSTSIALLGALEGTADLYLAVPRARMAELGEFIDARYPGAGKTFSSILEDRAAVPRPRASRRPRPKTNRS